MSSRDPGNAAIIFHERLNPPLTQRVLRACDEGSAIRMRVTSIRRPPATMRSMLAVASPALTSSTRSSDF
jgi:hypothetical protein